MISISSRADEWPDSTGTATGRGAPVASYAQFGPRDDESILGTSLMVGILTTQTVRVPTLLAQADLAISGRSFVRPGPSKYHCQTTSTSRRRRPEPAPGATVDSVDPDTSMMLIGNTSRPGTILSLLRVTQLEHTIIPSPSPRTARTCLSGLSHSSVAPVHSRCCSQPATSIGEVYVAASG